ncbi:MAG: methyltransferase, partial [Solirubrobacterales bacterium]
MGGSAVEAEPGSFRDPDGRVFIADGSVRRALSPRGAADWQALKESPLFGELVAEGSLVATSEVDASGAPGILVGEVAAVLEHERIPFISWPYEWPFGMLQD